VSQDGEHSHTFGYGINYPWDSGGGGPNHRMDMGGQTKQINAAGRHNHTLSGGDAETAPVHVYMAFMIRAE
jgi:hypothetical protein